MAFVMRGHMLPGIKQRVDKAGVCESCCCVDCQCSPSPNKRVSGVEKDSPNKRVECAAYGGGVTKGKYEGMSQAELSEKEPKRGLGFPS